MILRRALVSVGLLTVACAPLIGVSDQEWLTIRAWLTCEECTQAQLQAVEQIGTRASPILEVFMQDSLPPDRRENMRRRLQADWLMLRRRGVTADSVQFVQRYMSNITAVTQMRSATALATLEEWDILREAQDSAQARIYRDDVLGHIQHVMYTDALLRDTTALANDGVITGRVLRQGTNVGVPAVSVELISCGQGNTAFSPARLGVCQPGSGGWGVSNDTIANQGGYYSFSGLREGIYQITISGFDLNVHTGPLPFSRICIIVGDNDTEVVDFPLTT